MNLTKAQRRALLWLTPHWQRRTRDVCAAVDTLCLYHRDLAVTKFEHGAYMSRLTPAGADAKAKLAEGVQP